MNVQEQINQYFSLLREWNASYEDYAKSVGLSYTHLQILHTIYDTENCTQKLLCERCFLPKQTVNLAITAFYKQGFILLKETQKDRRAKTIHFTPKGEEYAKNVLMTVKDGENTAMNNLTAEQREMLLALTEKYVRNCMKTLQNLISNQET